MSSPVRAPSAWSCCARRGGNIDAIFVPVGGGGLIAGIAVYVKYLYPNIRIIGVEPEDAAGMYESLKAGRRVTLDRVGIFADGVAVKRVGEETFSLCREHVDEIVLLDTDEICAAIQDVFEDTRSIVEPAGALAVAGLKKYVAREGWRDKRVVAINSGANINFDRLRHVAERADLGGEREALLAVTIPEQPGSFLRFCEVLGNRNVTEFNYRYESERAAQIFVSFGLAQGRAEKDAVIRALRDAGYAVTDMTDNEMAKLHVRYMVGGHARGIRDELLYRFEFPERPGALLSFLQAVGGALEHQPVPLPQSRLRLRPGARRHPGAFRRARGFPAAPERAALRLRRGDGQSGLPDVPGRLSRAGAQSRDFSRRLSQLASAIQPPSTGRLMPLTKPLRSSSARNAIASATSSGRAKRPIGTRLTMSASE